MKMFAQQFSCFRLTCKWRFKETKGGRVKEVDDSSDSFGIDNKQITDEQSKWIPDANQWTYSNITKQNGYQMPINGLTLASQIKENKCNKQEETSCQ